MEVRFSAHRSTGIRVRSTGCYKITIDNFACLLFLNKCHIRSISQGVWSTGLLRKFLSKNLALCLDLIRHSIDRWKGPVDRSSCFLNFFVFHSGVIFFYSFLEFQNHLSKNTKDPSNSQRLSQLTITFSREI